MYKGGAVYIMSSPNRGTLYIGVTSDLSGRAWEHKNKIYPDSFTAKYNCVVLVYFKYFEGIEEAIEEEKRLKKANRAYKESLIDSMNPNWNDLYDIIEL
ncbi:MAG: GIY-YIG nuclease family protein [Bacteroidetes bacterium]|nr:GIY-YIG nuclease family protein [Bacteroidota bacterium]